MRIEYSSAAVSNCDFVANNAYAVGTARSIVSFTSCSFEFNSAAPVDTLTGAIFFSTSWGAITNCVFTGNFGDRFGGIAVNVCNSAGGNWPTWARLAGNFFEGSPEPVPGQGVMVQPGNGGTLELASPGCNLPGYAPSSGDPSLGCSVCPSGTYRAAGMADCKACDVANPLAKAFEKSNSFPQAHDDVSDCVNAWSVDLPGYNIPPPTPSKAPTQAPIIAPSKAPTQAPTIAPSKAPTQAPTIAPSNAPTKSTSVNIICQSDQDCPPGERCTASASEGMTRRKLFGRFQTQKVCTKS